MGVDDPVVPAAAAVLGSHGQGLRAVRGGLLPAAALLLYMPAIHIWLHTEARYTAAARPLLLMFAAFAAKRIGHHFGQPAARGGNAPPNGEKGGDKARVS